MSFVYPRYRLQRAMFRKLCVLSFVLLTVVYTAGHLTLKADGTFNLSLTFDSDTGQSSSTTTQEHSGSWVASESGVTITYVEGHTNTVSISGDTATIVLGGDAFLFQR